MEKHIGNSIKQIAEAIPLKPQEIAYKWGKTTQAVYNLYRNQYPQADVLIEISQVLGVSVNRILGISEEELNKSENPPNLTKIEMELIQELREQLKIKDKQIDFLQNFIKDNISK